MPKQGKIVLKCARAEADSLVETTINRWVASYLQGRKCVPDGGLAAQGSLLAMQAAELIINEGLGEKPALSRVASYRGDVNLPQIIRVGLKWFARMSNTLLYVDSNPHLLRQICRKHKPKNFGAIDFESGGFALIDFEMQGGGSARFWGFEFHRPHPRGIMAFIPMEACDPECPECGHDLEFSDGCATCPCGYSKA